MDGPIESSASLSERIANADAGELIRFLRASEFRIGVAEALRVADLLSLLAESGRTPQSLEEVARWFGPILCTTPRHQAILEERLRVFFEQPQVTMPSPKQPAAIIPAQSNLLWPHWATMAAIALGLFIALIIYSGPPQDNHRLGAPRTEVARGDTSFATPVPPDSVAMRLTQSAPIVVIPLLLWLLFLRSRPKQEAALERRPESGGERIELNTSGEKLRLFDSEDLVRRAGASAQAKQDATQLSSRLRHALQGMRTYRVTRSNTPDVCASVRATAKAGGFPRLLFGNRARLPDYPVLVETRSGRDHLPEIAMAIGERLTKEGVPYSLYRFDTDPLLLRTDSKVPMPVSLADLASRYDKDVLILLADVDCLLDPMSGLPRTWVYELEDWRRVVVMTPLSPRRWSWRQLRVAMAGIRVLHASPAGVIALGEMLRANVAGVNPLLLRPPARLGILSRDGGRAPCWHSDNAPAGDDRDAVMQAIQMDLSPRLFELLCVLALFPELRPDLTLHVAATLRGADGRSAFDEADYATLCALPWFRVGRIPQWLRCDLVGTLSPVELDRAREMYNHWLKPASKRPSGDGKTVEIVRPGKTQIVSARRDGIFLHFLKGDDLTDIELVLKRELLDSLKPEAYREELQRKRARNIALATSALLWLGVAWFDQLTGGIGFRNWRVLWNAMSVILLLGIIGGIGHSLRRPSPGRFGIAPPVALIFATLAMLGIWVGQMPNSPLLVLVALCGLMLPCLAMALAPSLSDDLMPLSAEISWDRGVTMPAFLLIGLGLGGAVWVIGYRQFPYVDPYVQPFLALYGFGIALLQGPACDVSTRTMLLHTVPGALMGYAPAILVTMIPDAGFGTASSVALLFGAIGAHAGSVYGISSVRQADIRPALGVCAAAAALGSALIVAARLVSPSGSWTDLGYFAILPLSIVLPVLTLCMPFAMQRPGRLPSFHTLVAVIGAALGALTSLVLVKLVGPLAIRTGLVEAHTMHLAVLPLALLVAFVNVPFARASMLIGSTSWRAVVEGLRMFDSTRYSRLQGYLVIALWIVCLRFDFGAAGVLQLKWLALPIAVYLASQERRGTITVLIVGVAPLFFTTSSPLLRADPALAGCCIAAYLFVARPWCRNMVIGLPHCRFSHLLLWLLMFGVSIVVKDKSHAPSVSFTMPTLIFWTAVALGLTQVRRTVVVSALVAAPVVALIVALLREGMLPMDWFRPVVWFNTLTGGAAARAQIDFSPPAWLDFLQTSLGSVSPLTTLLAYAISRRLCNAYIPGRSKEASPLFTMLGLLMFLALSTNGTDLFVDLTIASNTSMGYHGFLLIMISAVLMLGRIATSARVLTCATASLCWFLYMVGAGIRSPAAVITSIIGSASCLFVAYAFRHWLMHEGADFGNALAQAAERETHRLAERARNRESVLGPKGAAPSRMHG